MEPRTTAHPQPVNTVSAAVPVVPAVSVVLAILEFYFVIRERARREVTDVGVHAGDTPQGNYYATSRELAYVGDVIGAALKCKRRKKDDGAREPLVNFPHYFPPSLYYAVHNRPAFLGNKLLT